MTTPISNIDNTTLLNLTPNLDIGDIADPALRLSYFQYLNVYIQSITTAFNAFVASGAVGSVNLADLSVLTTKIADLAVTTGKIADLAVTTAKLNDMSVTLAKMAANSVGTTQLIDGIVTTPKLANGAVTFLKLDPALVAADISLNMHRLNSVLDHPDGSVTEEKLESKLTNKVNSRNYAIHGISLNEETVPTDALKRAILAITQTSILRVAFVGDSITESGGLNNIDDCYVNRVTAALKKHLPNTTITVQNFGLGGRYLAQFNDPTYVGANPETLTTFWRSWSTIGKSWKDTVRDWNPDLVILAFGMNDANGNLPNSDTTFATGLASATATMSAWISNPSVVLIPTILPTTNPAYYAQRQDVTNSVARATRIFAKNNKLAVADASRLFQILRDGVDETTRASIYEKNWNGYPTGWTGNTSGYTLASSTLTPSTGGVVQRTRIFFNGTIEVSVKPSLAGDSGVAVINYRVSDLGMFTLYVAGGSGTGYVRLYKYEVSGGYTQLQQTSSLSIPAGSATVIKIVAEDDNHKVYVAGVEQINQTVYDNLHDGYVSMGSASSSFPTFSNLTINFKDRAVGIPLYTEVDLLGVFGINDAGNGINHPTPLGHALFYLSAFNGIFRELSRAKDGVLTGIAQQAIFNSGFAIASKGTSFTNPASSDITLDNVRVTNVADGGTNPTIVLTQQVLAPGTIPDESFYYNINVNGAGSSFGANAQYGVEMRIENGVRLLAGTGRTLTVSVWLKSTITNKKVGMFLTEIYGTGGSPSSAESINGSYVTLTTTWTKYTFTFTLNTTVGKTFGTNNDDLILLRLYTMWGTSIAARVGAGSTAETFVGSGDISVASFRANSGSIEIASTPKTIPDEEDRLMRYNQRYTAGNTFGIFGMGQAISTTSAIIYFPFKKRMKTLPAFTKGGAFQLTNASGTTLAVTNITSDGSGIRSDGAQLVVTVASGLVAGNATYLSANNDTAAFLNFEASL